MIVGHGTHHHPPAVTELFEENTIIHCYPYTSSFSLFFLIQFLKFVKKTWNIYCGDVSIESLHGPNIDSISYLEKTIHIYTFLCDFSLYNISIIKIFLLLTFFLTYYTNILLLSSSLFLQLPTVWNPRFLAC